MARLGRTHAEYRLGRPVVVFAPPAPTQQQQTITVAFAQTVARRGSESRRFPLQGWEGTTQRTQGSATEYGSASAGAPNRNLGPRPPQITLPRPAQRLQTVIAWDTPAQWSARQELWQQRAPHSRLKPPATLEPWTVALAERQIAVHTVKTRPRPIRSVLAKPATLEPESVFLAERTPRVSLVRTRPRPTRFLLAEPTVLQTFAGPKVSTTRLDLRRRGPRSLLSPPAVVTPLSTQVFKGPLVALVRTRPRFLFSTFVFPTVVTSGPLGGIGVQLAAARRPQTRSFLSPPILPTVTAQVFSGPRVHLVALPARVLPQRTTIPVAFVEEPTVLQVFGGPQVTTVKTRPRPIRSVLFPGVSEPSLRPPDRRLEVTTTLARTRPRGTRYLLAPAATLEPETTALRERTITVALVRTRPRHTVAQYVRPVTYPQTSDVTITLVKTRPRPIRSQLLPPATLEPEAVALAERVVRVTVVRTRPRHTLGTALGQPQTLRVFSGPFVALTKTRPRHTLGTRLAPPTVVTPLPTRDMLTLRVTLVAVRTRVELPQRAPHSRTIRPATLEPESVELREETVAVSLVRTRPRQTRWFLTSVFYPATSEITTTLVKTRPRATHPLLHAPATLEAESIQIRERTVLVSLVRIRPRKTIGVLQPPATLTPESIELQEATIRVQIVRTRPRHTISLLRPPTALQVFVVPVVAFTKIRPRHTLAHLAPPTVVRIPSVEQVEQTVRVQTVRTRPRPTRTILALPTVITPLPTADMLTLRVRTVAVRTRSEVGRRAAHYLTVRPSTLEPESVELREETILVALVRTRPRRTVWSLTNVSYPATSAIRVALVATRPRAIHSLLRGPATLEAEAVALRERTIAVALVRTRPRKTLARVAAPTVLRVPSVEQLEDTIRVQVVRTRPQPTAKHLAPPTVLQVFPGPVETEVAVRTPLEDRRRLPHSKLGAPTVVRVPSVDQLEQTVRVSLTRARPRKTTYLATRPATLEPEAVEIAERTIRVQLVRIRPPHTVARLTYTAYPQTTVLTVALVRTRPRKTRWFLTNISYPQTSTVAVHLVRTRPRRTVWSLRAPTALQVFSGPSVFTTRLDLRRRPTRTHLSPPTVVAAAPPLFKQATLSVFTTSLDLRRRGTHVKIEPPIGIKPIAVITTPGQLRIATTLVAVRTRVEVQRRAAHSRLGKPTTLQVFAGPTVSLVRIRPRHTLGTSLGAPQALRVFAGPVVALVKTRPRPTRRFLQPPTVLRVPSVEQVEDTIRVATVVTRPRPVHSLVRAPRVVTPFAPTAPFAPVAVVLTRVRRPLFTGVAHLRPPAVITTPLVRSTDVGAHYPVPQWSLEQAKQEAIEYERNRQRQIVAVELPEYTETVRGRLEWKGLLVTEDYGFAPPDEDEELDVLRQLGLL